MLGEGIRGEICAQRGIWRGMRIYAQKGNLRGREFVLGWTIWGEGFVLGVGYLERGGAFNLRGEV